jgi:polysaccharide biosynthesis protein PslH
MRVLLLTQVVPNPPDAGPKIKTHYALRMLAREHQIELLTFARDEREAAAAAALREWCERVTVVPLARRRLREPLYLARGWAAGAPFLVARDHRGAFARLLHQRLAQGAFDVIHADQLAMAQYLPPTRPGGARTVFDAHNAVYDLVRELAPRQRTPAHRLAAAIEWRLLRRYEGGLARASSLTLTVSRRDRELLAAAAGEPIRATVVPIGTEVEAIPPVPPNPAATRLLSVATMHYPPNAEALRWFRDEVWPLVRLAHPAAGLDVVGPRPPDDLAGWGAADERVRVPGFVADLDPLYRDAAIFIVPLRSGSGVRVKILEAMARGVAVVSTAIGAAGLALRHGEHLLIADTPDEFARAILQLLTNPSRRAALATAARERVLALYDWRRCCLPLLDAYRALVAGPATAPGAGLEERADRVPRTAV